VFVLRHQALLRRNFVGSQRDTLLEKRWLGVGDEWKRDEHTPRQTDVTQNNYQLKTFDIRLALLRRRRDPEGFSRPQCKPLSRVRRPRVQQGRAS